MKRLRLGKWEEEKKKDGRGGGSSGGGKKELFWIGESELFFLLANLTGCDRSLAPLYGKITLAA